MKIIAFCPSMMILIIIEAIFHKLFFLKNGCGWGELPSACDHLDTQEMSVSYVLGASTTIERNLNFKYAKILLSSSR